MKSEEAQLKEKPKDSNNIHYSKTSIDNLPFDVSKDLDQFMFLKNSIILKLFIFAKIICTIIKYSENYQTGIKNSYLPAVNIMNAIFVVVVMIAPAFYVVAHMFFVTQFHFKWIIEEMDTHFILKE